ncbi:MAG: DUF1573 domain-containing protein [Bacteroidales bacterium]|nr:DUF1573 domain-containing protein [Bacteroidales bacterium]
MKHIIFSVVLLFAGVSAFAQENAPAGDNPNAPIMTFDQKHKKNNQFVYDYGTIEKGANGQCYFVFTNTGKEPLVIEKATSSCGCTVPNPPKYPILPGQTDSIAVKYDTKRVGGINKTINIVSNASNSPMSLRISGNVVESTPAIPENNTSNPLMIKREE